MPVYVMPDVSGSRHDDYLPNIERFRTRDELETSITFNEEKPLDTIRQYISGMRWEVEYFNQLQNLNEEYTPLDINTAVTNQQYLRVHKLILFVNDPISHNGIREINGSALINADFTPYKGDHFVTTLAGGRIGLFVIEEVNKNDYNLHQVFEIQYKLDRMLNEEPEIYNNLIKKVVRNYVYNQNSSIDGNTKLLTRDEFSLVEDLKRAEVDITEYYFKTFLDPDSCFLKIPTSNNMNYVDQELCKFIRSVFSVMDAPELVNMESVDYDMDKTIRYTIWDVLRKRDPHLISRAEPFIGFKRSPHTRSNLNALEPSLMSVDYIVDKFPNLAPLTGIEDTKKPIDRRVNIYQILKAIQEEDKKSKQKAQHVWEVDIPGLDFTTIARNTPEGRKLPPKPIQEQPKPIYPKKHNEGKPKEVLPIDTDKEACTDCVENKIDKVDKKTLEEIEEIGKKPPTVQPIDLTGLDGITHIPKAHENVQPIIRTANVQPIKSTKQYQRFAKKGQP